MDSSLHLVGKYFIFISHNVNILFIIYLFILQASKDEGDEGINVAPASAAVGDTSFRFGLLIN